jgi:hypothetical protein
MQQKINNVQPEIGKKIKFYTIVGWLIGERTIIKTYSNKYEYYVSHKIKENKHWAAFIKNEVFEWEYL